MRFYFALDALLRIRALREEAERKRLLLSQFRVDESRRAIRDLTDREDESRRAYFAPESRMRGSELHLLESWLQQNRKALTAAEKQLIVYEQEQSEQQLRFLSMHRDAEVLRQLREQRWESYVRELRRLEQKQLDEAFTLTARNGSRQRLPSK